MRVVWSNIFIANSARWQSSWPSLDSRPFHRFIEARLTICHRFSLFPIQEFAHHFETPSTSYNNDFCISNKYILFLKKHELHIPSPFRHFSVPFTLFCAWHLRIVVTKWIIIIYHNLCIIFGTCEMRRLNQMSNLSRIFDCFSRRFDVSRI